MSFIDTVRKWLHHGDVVEEPWAANEETFEEQFGISYEEFSRKVEELDEEQTTKYRSALEAHPEAAVLWVLALEKR